MTVPMDPDERQTAHGYLLLQAAVAEGALGDIPVAYRRAEELADLGDTAVATLARIASDFVCRWSLLQGADWTTSKDADGNHVNIEEHSPERRVFTRRLLAAWSVGDADTFEALLATVCADPTRRASHLQDLFQVMIDEAEMHGKRAGQPFSIVRQLNKSVLKEGFKKGTWNSAG
ncbi:hypothetical protein ACPC54_40745 [Kitasatospora sp. NPDC094028]